MKFFRVNHFALIPCALLAFGLGSCSVKTHVKVIESPSSYTISPSSKESTSNKGIIVQCNAYNVSIMENTVFRPGKDIKTSYTVSSAYIKDGEMKARIMGSSEDKSSAINVIVRVGESVTSPTVGTFTLLDVVIRSREPGRPGGGNIAVFCFEPAAGFQVNQSLQTQ